MRKLALHWRILIAMAIGVGVGLAAVHYGQQEFIANWVKPFGEIFIRLLKLIAIPIVIASLVKGISELRNLTQLSRIGLRTAGLYLATTVLAISLGLSLVNITKPGKLVTEETRTTLMASYGEVAERGISTAMEQKEKGPLQPLVEIFPENIFKSASDNRNMLQVIFFAILFGIAMVMSPPEKVKTIRSFFDGLFEVIMRCVDIVMLFAPFGVFALIAAIVAEAPSADIFSALLGYALTVLLGLAILVFIIYPSLVKLITGRSPGFFFRGISPAQLVAFSTSSSAATLPVTMERVEEHLGVDKEVSSFVLPVGATLNMDGTCLYQGVATVFIAQALGIDLSLTAQLGIILTATLASIGTAAVPGVGIIMLVMILTQAGVPEQGLALILAIDRPLDMCRTTVNVTSDAAISMVVAKSMDKLGEPAPRQAGI